MEDAMFKHIISYTEYIVSHCPPRQLLYIGVDGVAPLAKVMQQRKRRHMSAMRNDKIYAFKNIHNIPYTTWDSNCITPGTEFMRKLQCALTNYYSTHQRPYEVYISSHEECGEGEHKIIRYIKALGEDGMTDIIYGLDADLMMLALTCQRQKLFLMREGQQFGHHKHYTPPFKYVDIKYLTSCICSDGDKAERTGRHDRSDHSLLFDYVFVCFMLGNDFLPHSPSLEIKNNGIDILCDIMMEARDTYKSSIVQYRNDKYVVDMTMLLYIFQKLSQKEEELLVQNITHYKERFNKPHPIEATNIVDHFMKELEMTPMLQAQSNGDVCWNPTEEPAWKAAYYEHFFQQKNTDIDAVDDICLNYIQGLLWNVDYYFNKQTNNDWFYKYRTAPCMSDMYGYMNKMLTSNGSIPEIPPSMRVLTSDHQLLMVLPKQSVHLLGPHLQKYMCDINYGLSYMYPQTFQIHMDLKSQLWECIPILPSVDVDAILSISP
jgi:5'-3' exonuclease